MTNPAGRLWENRVVEFLRPVFPRMDRDRKRGRFDKGEFVNTGDWTFECKATKVMNLSGALDEAEQERKRNETRWCAAIIKRRNHVTAKAYVVVELGMFRELLKEMKHGGSVDRRGAGLRIRPQGRAHPSQGDGSVPTDRGRRPANDPQPAA